MNMNQVWEQVSILLGLAMVLAFILVGGYMIGSATAHSNRMEHERQIECIEHDGHMERMTTSSDIVCQKR